MSSDAFIVSSLPRGVTREHVLDYFQVRYLTLLYGHSIERSPPSCSHQVIMAHLHCRTRTRIQVLNPMATLHCAEHFTLHRLGPGSLLPVSV